MEVPWGLPEINPVTTLLKQSLNQRRVCEWIEGYFYNKQRNKSKDYCIVVGEVGQRLVRWSLGGRIEGFTLCTKRVEFFL